MLARRALSSLFLLLVAFSLVSLVVRFGSGPVLSFLGYQPQAGIKITSSPEAVVYINEIEVGRTPYNDESLTDQDYEVKLISPRGEWKSRIRLNSGTISVVNRELAPSVASSSGEVLLLSFGKGVVVTSNPSGASVEVDGKLVGQTPLSVGDLSVGEHIFLLRYQNYVPRSVRATIPDKLVLNLSVDLALAEAALIISPTLQVVTLKQGVVLSTPTGFLRIRSRPSLTASEIARIRPGDELVILEESPGWVKIRTKENTEGYVSSDYVETRM